MNKVILNGVDLSIEDVVNVARNGYQVEIDKDCMAHIAEVRNHMESEWMRDDAPPFTASHRPWQAQGYKVTIEESDLHQYRTVLSHCGGVGDPAPEEVVRAAMCVRLNAFCRGVSGLRPVVVERLVELLNKGVHPVVPWQGSVGACGDLAPWLTSSPFSSACPGGSLLSGRAHACGKREKARRVGSQSDGLALGAALMFRGAWRA